MIWHLLPNTTVAVQEKYNIVQRHFKTMIVVYVTACYCIETLGRNYNIEIKWVLSTFITQHPQVV